MSPIPKQESSFLTTKEDSSILTSKEGLPSESMLKRKSSLVMAQQAREATVRTAGGPDLEGKPDWYVFLDAQVQKAERMIYGVKHKLKMPAAHSWSSPQVASWLELLGLGVYAEGR